MGFGTFWGTSWGGGPETEGEFSVASAYASSSQTFVIVFTKRPLALSPAGATDVTNLTNVMLVNLDTNVAVPLMASALMSSVESIQYYMMHSFQPSQAGYRVTVANQVVGYLGEVLVDPKFALFPGMVSTQMPIQQRRPLLDLLNPQTSGDMYNGGLINGSDGDYVKEGGTQLMRKLITRRVVTAIGEFYHLADTDYGFGIQEKLTPTTADLVALRTGIEQNVAKEPGVQSVGVVVTLQSTGILLVDIVATLQRTNQQLAFSVPFYPANAGAL